MNSFQLLVELVTRKMRTNTDNLTLELFEAVREERARTYHNVLIKPHKLAKYVLKYEIFHPLHNK